MIRRETGPGFPKEPLTRPLPTRCEVCSHYVWPHFPQCELPCPRGNVPRACWHVCIFCGAMRLDWLPVTLAPSPSEPSLSPPPLQGCVCDGKRVWEAMQADARLRAPRQWTVREYLEGEAAPR